MRRSPELVRCSSNDICLAYNWNEKEGLTYLSTTASQTRSTYDLIQHFKPPPPNGSITIFLAYDIMDQDAQTAYDQNSSDSDQAIMSGITTVKKVELKELKKDKALEKTKKLTLNPPVCSYDIFQIY